MDGMKWPWISRKLHKRQVRIIVETWTKYANLKQRRIDILESQIMEAQRATGLLINGGVGGDSGLESDEERYVPNVSKDAEALCKIIRELGV